MIQENEKIEVTHLLKPTNKNDGHGYKDLIYLPFWKPKNKEIKEIMDEAVRRLELRTAFDSNIEIVIYQRVGVLTGHENGQIQHDGRYLIPKDPNP